MTIGNVTADSATDDARSDTATDDVTTDGAAGDERPVVSIVVVSYNTREMTLECLESIGTQTSTPHEVIVIDNASGDGSAEAIAERFPTVQLIASSENHGFARANNIAARRARGELLLLLNPDTVVLDRAIDELVAFARQEPAARIWGGVTRFGDGSLNPASCWRRMTLASIFWRVSSLDRRFPDSPVLNSEAYGGWQRDSDRPVDIVSGCFLMIDRDLWNDLRGFDETYVMYGEEADLCLRSQHCGAQPMVTARSQIIHHGGASETVRGHKHTRLIAAKITLARRYLPVWQRPIGVWLLRSWPLMRSVVSAAPARFGSGGGSVEVHDGWMQVWRNRPQWWHGYPSAPQSVADVSSVGSRP